MFRLLQKSRQPCYAQPIQARLIPDCKNSFLHCSFLTSRLHFFSRVCLLRLQLQISGLPRGFVVMWAGAEPGRGQKGQLLPPKYFQ